MNGDKEATCILFVTFIQIYLIFHTIFFLFRCFGKSSFSFLWTLKSDE